MIKIYLEHNKIIIKGHSEEMICQMVTVLSQFLCSNLLLTEYIIDNGFLEAHYIADDFSKKLIDNYKKYLSDTKLTQIFIEDRR